MFDKLKKLLEGGVAQVNPWDNGKTFQSVVNNHTPQQQNAVQQQQQQARVFNPARPQQAPQQNLTDKLRDILDANSQADKYRRAQMGQATSYQEQQAKAPNVYNQVAGAAEKFSRYHPLLNPMAGLNLANDASNAKLPGIGVSTQDVARQIPQATGQVAKGSVDVAKGFVANPMRVGKMIAYPIIEAEMSGKLNRGEMTYDSYKSIVDQAAKEAGIGLNDSSGTVLRKTGGAVFGTAGDILTAGTMSPKMAGGLVTGKLGKATEVSVPLINKVAGGIGTGAALGAANTLQRDQVTPESVATDVVGGAAIGGAFPVALAGGGKVIGALGRQFRKPRSVAEITQEVATARQPVIANNAPRVTPDGTQSMAPRSASQIAKELADSKARALDPNVQARRAAITGSAPAQPRVNIHPDDQAIIRDLNDYVAGTYKPGTVGARRLETDAAMIAEKYGLPVTRTTEELAEALDSLNARAKNPIFYKKPGDNKSVKQLAPKPSKQDPLEALKAEARKYKSAEEFVKEQPTYYHQSQSKTPFDDFKQKGDVGYKKASYSQAGEGIYFSPNKELVKSKYGQNGGALLEVSIVPKKKLDLGEYDAMYFDGRKVQYGDIVTENFKRSMRGEAELPEPDIILTGISKKAKAWLEKNGYDAVSGMEGEMFSAPELVVLDKSIIKTKSKLTDLYNQATKPKAYYQNVPKSYTGDPLEALKAEARKYKSAEEFVNSKVSRPKTTDNVWQDTLPSGTRPDSIKKVTKSGGNPLYHDTTADGVLGILESGEIKASQAPFSSIAGQGRRVSTTRNFDNYSRYNKSPYRLVIDESRTGQRAIPDNRDEFESIFRKGVSTKAVNSVAIDTTNPALLDDIRSGKLKNVIESAKKKGITIEPFEGKVLPNEGANAEVQTMTSRAFSEAFPEYKTRISQLIDLYNQAVDSKATKPPKAYYQNVPKSYTEGKADPNRNWKLSNQVDDGYRTFDDAKKAANAKMNEFRSNNNGKPFTKAQQKELEPYMKAMEDGLNKAKQANAELNPTTQVTPKPTPPKSYTEPKTAFEQNTSVVAPTRAKATIQEPVVKSGAVEQPKAIGEGMPPAKAGASPAAPVLPRKPGKKGKTNTALNTNRMDLTPEQRAQLDPKVQAVVDTMSNEDVVRVAKGAGLDTNTYSPGETRVKIAEQLNARQDVVRIMNEAEVARKAGDTERAAELLKQAAEQGRTVRSQGTDLGRQLQARKIIANELDTPQQRVFKLLDEAGVNPDVYAKRFAGVDFTDFKQVVDAYRELVPAKAGQWLDTVRYNSMLSSPLTQMVNIFGNAQGVLGVAPIEKTIRGGIDSIAGLFGKERQYAAGEGAAYLKGEAKAVGKAAKAFMNALRGVNDYANQDFTDYNIPLATQGAGGKVYNALSFPMRVLDGMDKFFRTLAAAGEDAALTKRTSKGIALKGDRQSLLEQEAAYRVFQADSHIPGQGAALNAMDSIADLVMSGRNNKNPIVRTLAKFTIPFVKTINNINKQGNFEYSPLGFLNLIGKEDKVEGITRAVMGTAVFGTSALMLKGGDMTWAEPRNAEERARFRAEGKQPYAVKIGGKWVGFSKLHPAVSFPMAMTAALDDAFNKGEIDQSFIDKTLTGFAKYGNFMSDQSYAKSVGDTLGAIGGDKEAIARAVSNQWQQLIPARALTGWIARMSDDVERKVDTTAGYFDQQVQAFMQQYPGLRQKTPTRDYRGEPIAANNPVLNAFSPVRVTNDRGVNPLDAEQDAIKAATEQPELLNKRQLKEIDDRTADKVREAQKQLISQPGWSDLTPEEKKSGLSRLESDIKAVEKLQYQAEKQVGQYSGSFTGKSTKLTANQKALINDGVKIGKYVGKSDSTEAKTNKEKYEQALEKFNDPDNGYSKVEKVKKTEELKRLTVQKDYDEDTTMLHGMSKEDVWGFLSTYEDGKAMADKLLALDDALTAAGVQDKNKFRDKYGNIAIKPKEKSSGKGGSKAKTVKGQAEAVSSERKLRALLANTNNKTSYRKPATQSAKVGLKKFAVKSAGITSRKGA